MKLPISLAQARRILEQLGYPSDEPVRRTAKLPFRPCRKCGLNWPYRDLVQVLDEEDRPLGWFCQGCA